MRSSIERVEIGRGAREDRVRRILRRVVATIVGVAALAGLVVGVPMRTEGGDPGLLWLWPLCMLVLAFLLCISVAKWVCLIPFSAFRIVPLAMLAVRQSWLSALWWIAFVAALVIMITVGPGRSLPLVTVAVAAVALTAIGAGYVAGRAEARPWILMRTGRAALARAAVVSPEEVSDGLNVGTTARPIFRFGYPDGVRDEDVPYILATFTASQRALEIIDADGRHMDVAAPKIAQETKRAAARKRQRAADRAAAPRRL